MSSAADRTQSATEKLQTFARIVLEHQIRAQYPSAVSARIVHGRLESATLADGTNIASFGAGIDLTMSQMAVIGVPDTATDLELNLVAARDQGCRISASMSVLTSVDVTRE